MTSYPVWTVVLSAEGQVSGADSRDLWDRCGSGSVIGKGGCVHPHCA